MEEETLKRSRTLIFDSKGQTINDLKKELAKKDEEIADLKRRLGEAIHMNNINKNQELIALKQDIGAALKLRHDKFIENQAAVCNEDNYEALKASIHQIFRVLKRYRIEF